jgi:hypothetical protein
MAYSRGLREAAFSLYSQGLSLRQIARRVSETHAVQLDHTTIAVWVHRHNWPARRLRLQRRIEDRADEKWVSDAASLLDRLFSLRDTILVSVENESFKSAESAVRSLAIVQKVIASLLRSPDDVITLDQLEHVMAVVLQVFHQDEVLGPVLASRAAAILARIEDRLAPQPELLSSGESHDEPV